MDGELSGLEAAALERHLEHCAACEALGVSIGAFTLVLRDEPLKEPRRSLALPAPRARRVRRRAAGVGALAIGLASMAAILSVPSTPVFLTTASSALEFRNAQEAIDFAHSKSLQIEPRVEAVAAAVDVAPVPVFALRAVR